MNYTEFIENKARKSQNTGFETDKKDYNSCLFDYQKDIIHIALKKGNYAVFADCGLGKTLIEIEWAKQVNLHTQKPVLIFAPLEVCSQTIEEAKKFNYDVDIQYAEDSSKVGNGVYITNYDRADKFDGDILGGVVLDESSILKNYVGATKRLLQEKFSKVDFKLCATATPSPNDHIEILNQAEFLGILKSSEALTEWFINDTQKAKCLRLKEHAKDDFYRWLCSWSVSIDKPSDLGYSNEGFKLPELNIEEIVVSSNNEQNTDGKLFRIPETLNATNFNKEKKLSLSNRLEWVKNKVNNSHEQWLIWCETNEESEILAKNIENSFEIKGSTPAKTRLEKVAEFKHRKLKVLISKPSIFGYGLNFQNCNNTIFFGLSFSYESFYQSIKRFHRFGQTLPVNAFIVIGENEKSMLDIITEKKKQHLELKENMRANIKKYQDLEFGKTTKPTIDYIAKEYKTQSMRLINGDCVEEIKKLKDESVDFSIFSPPFSSLYIYSNSYRDMGNCKDDKEFIENFKYLIPELKRILKTGRNVAVHCKQLPIYATHAGFTGIRDIRGDIIRAFIDCGFAYHSEVFIWKDPVREMQRTKAHGLLYKQLRKDSSYSRQGMAEYLLIFRKWGDKSKEIPIDWKTQENFKLPKWQEYASPCWESSQSEQDFEFYRWMDIRQTNVLNGKVAKENADEKHICLATGSLVLTKRGYIPIEDIIPYQDEVVTHTGKWQKVIAKKMTKENADVIQLKALGVPKLILTPNHKLYAKKSYGVRKKDHLHKVQANWIEAESCKGLYVNQKLPEVQSSELTNTEWWIIGRYLADGHIDTRRHQFFVSIGNKKVNEFETIAKNHIGSKRIKEGCIQYGLKKLSKQCRDILFKCGIGAKNKQVPLEAICLEHGEQLESFLNGYEAGDGCYINDKLYITSVSRALLLGLSLCYQRKGKIASIYAGRGERTQKIKDRTINCSQEWNMVISPQYSFGKILEDGAWKPVKECKKADNTNVWSIQVENDASYLAEGCIVKNCPLQLDVIERAIEMWTNPDDVVFTPFLGIGSEVYQALKMGRRGIGIELKESYYNQAIKYCNEAISTKTQLKLF